MSLGDAIEKFTGIRILRSRHYLGIMNDVADFYDLRDLLHWKSPEVPSRLAGYMLKNWSDSKAQIQQDLLVLYLLDERKNGFFVEFGATDGILRSNSFLLENKYDWQGILAEPGLNWIPALRNNRKSIISTSCVSSFSGQQVEFFESVHPEYSTIASFRESDYHSKAREAGQTYSVLSISLVDLLVENSAPAHIDYISIDTEGSEYAILSVFPFSKFTFGIITVEHNFNTNRELIFDLLTKNGYERVLMGVSDYDDWYINPKYVDIKKLAVD
jgi:hypothetical protein